MMVRKQVGTYEVLIFSDPRTTDELAYIYLYEPTDAYIGYVAIIKSGVPLPENVQWPNGILNIYFNETVLVPLLDTLRNERPVFVQYNTDLKWGSVGTDKEPVGEQEAPH